MANRIQLRRDTQANWLRVNPILEDGEPGLDITQNKIKYGDGSSTWTELAYASGSGGSISFDYSTVQEGESGPIDVTSITGNPGVGVSLTSDEWAQLMWTPNTANVTIDNIGTGGSVYNWAYVDDSGLNVENDTGTDNYKWKFTTTGNLTLPNGMIIDSYGTSGANATVTIGGDDTWIRIDNDGAPPGFYITANATGTAQGWHFGPDGSLSFPSGNLTISNSDYGDAISTTDSMTIGASGDLTLSSVPDVGNLSQINMDGFGNIQLRSIYNNATDYRWDFNSDGKLTLPVNGRIQTVGNTASAMLQWLPTDGNGSTSTAVTVSSTGVVILTDAPSNENEWVFGTDGTLTTPGNVTIGSGYGNISQIDTIFANNYAYANGVSILDGVGGSYGNTEVAQYLTNYDGDINFTSSVAIISNVDVITVLDSIRSPAYQFSNGVSILSGLGYGNAEVATYLASGNLETAQIHGNLTVGNLTVNGNITYINTNSYVVTDNIVQFASDNPADTLDVGFVAHRTVGSALQHTGLVRDASTGQWKLFSNVAAQPGSTVDFTGVVYDDLVLDKLYADTIHLTGTAPSTNLGAAGDLEGDIHVDDNYLYYCTTNWTASSWTVGWEGATSNTLFITKGDYPTPQVGWVVSNTSGYGPWTIDTVTDNGTNWQITWVGGSYGQAGGGTATLTNPNPAVIWKTVPLNTFQTGAYGNTQVASYLPTYGGNIGGNISIGGTLRINSANSQPFSTNDALYVVGGLTTGANISAGGRLVACSFATSTNINSGAIQTNGGIGAWGNIYAGQNVVATGNVSATYFIGDGSLLTNIASSGGSTYGDSNVASYLTTYSGNFTATSVVVTGNVTAANIITSGATSGNISGANYISANAVQVSTGIFWANGTAWSSGGGTTYTSTGAGNVTIVGSAINLTASGPGATTVGSSTAIPVVTTDAYGRVSTMTTAAVVAPAGTLSGSTLNATVTASSLTSVGTLVSLAVTGNVSAANVAVTNTVTAANIVTTGTYGNITGANVISANTVTVTTCVRTQPVTFSALPSASGVGAGARAFITDGNTSTFGSQVSGSGANAVPVYSNGTNWYVG
jgi:hypothetical protein